ncbi:hypothetical protein ACWEQC_32600 [Streptomyces shenzhenensis]
MRRRIDLRPRTRYMLVCLTALTLIVGLAVQVTARSTGTVTTASDIGLALTTLGTICLAITLPPALRSYYQWACGQGVTAHSRQLRLDATLSHSSAADVVRLDQRAK